jgi:hypothetical protein
VRLGIKERQSQRNETNAMEPDAMVVAATKRIKENFTKKVQNE